uniref:RNA polymerase II subunit B1 CTD phosphatase RPAP2 homolog n=1 Tax=Oryzias melastigma TaxID=30732 RepID=A0A3B3DQN4_ORYME
MATVGRMKSPGKTSRKAGRRSKTLTAEEEARRKEELREQLKEKMELERRALEVVEQLLESSVEQDFLLDSATFITPANYRDAVEERSISKLCGYPVCPNQLGKVRLSRPSLHCGNSEASVSSWKHCCSLCRSHLSSSKFVQRPTEFMTSQSASGSAGEEVLLSQKRLKEEDVEKPPAAEPDAPCRDHGSAGEDSSDGEQDFVSSVGLQQQKPRVHWADLPQRGDGSKNWSQGGGGQAEQLDSPDRPPVEEVTAQRRDTAPGLPITQVGVSRRGAAGLRALLGGQSAHLLETLRRTLQAWCTDHTIKFLHGATCSLASSRDKEGEEELDEDDDEDEVVLTDDLGDGRQRGSEPDYEALLRLTQQMELREFYKGTGDLPVEPRGNQNLKEAVLPLIDSHAQHLIQKRITVEKLSSCLRSMVGPLHLTMSDISTDLNDLVRTFRFTSTNIVHRVPEWTLIAVVLLHVLSAVSPVVREALQVSTSVDYVKTLLQELGLEEQHLLSLVELFNPPL